MAERMFLLTPEMIQAAAQVLENSFDALPSDAEDVVIRVFHEALHKSFERLSIIELGGDQVHRSTSQSGQFPSLNSGTMVVVKGP